MMNYSRVKDLKKSQKQLQINIPRTSYNNLMFEAAAGTGTSSSSSSSSSSSDHDQDPKLSPLTYKNQQQELQLQKPGFLSLLPPHDHQLQQEEPIPKKKKHPFLIQNNHIVLSCRLDLYKGLLSKTNLEEDYQVQKPSWINTTNPSSNLSKKLNILQFGSSQLLRIRHDNPCVFEPAEYSSSFSAADDDDHPFIIRQESIAAAACGGGWDIIRGHAIISPEGNACFRPLTFCSVHKSAGFLRLQDIQDSEFYSCLDVKFPVPKLTHCFNDCILQFPPVCDSLIVFKAAPIKPEEFLSPPLAPPPPAPPLLPRRPLRRTYNSFPFSYKLSPRIRFKFLRYCIDCCRVLVSSGEVYIYRGDAWFCSEECRYLNTKKLKVLEAKTERELKCERAKIEQGRSEIASSKDKAKSIFVISDD